MTWCPACKLGIPGLSQEIALCGDHVLTHACVVIGAPKTPHDGIAVDSDPFLVGPKLCHCRHSTLEHNSADVHGLNTGCDECECDAYRRERQ